MRGVSNEGFRREIGEKGHDEEEERNMWFEKEVVVKDGEEKAEKLRKGREKNEKKKRG
jgi:hypothetical protein